MKLILVLVAALAMTNGARIHGHGIFGGIGGIVSGVGWGVGNIMHGVGEVLGGVGEIVGGSLRIPSSILEGVGEILGGIFLNGIVNIENPTEFLEAFLHPIRQFGLNINNGLQTLNEALTSILPEFILSDVSDIIESVEQLTTDIIDEVTDSIEDAFREALAGGATNAGQFVNIILREVNERLRVTLPRLIDESAEEIAESVARIVEVYPEIISNISQNVPELVDEILDRVDHILGVNVRIIPGVNAIVTQLITRVIRALPNVNVEISVDK